MEILGDHEDTNRIVSRKMARDESQAVICRQKLVIIAIQLVIVTVQQLFHLL
jgi:hypothetical protein